jgi:hypothetical protein
VLEFARAVPVFPADDPTDEFFKKVPKTHDNLDLLGRYLNFAKVRWVPPGNIQVIGR